MIKILKIIWGFISRGDLLQILLLGAILLIMVLELAHLIYVRLF